MYFKIYEATGSLGYPEKLSNHQFLVNQHYDVQVRKAIEA